MRADLERALDDASGVLFLCSGNMVRSAFAELYARHLGCPLPVSSAATIYRNDRILPETASALRERGGSETFIAGFRPRHLADVLCGLDARTLTFGMTSKHLAALERRPELRARAFLLEEIRGRQLEIADPVLDGADFERTFDHLARCVEALVASLAAR